MNGLLTRIVGPAPPNGAPRIERLRWIRRLGLRTSTPLVVLVCADLLAMSDWILAGICAAVQVYAIASISLSIRRESRR
jgi:hypothetical protein